MAYASDMLGLSDPTADADLTDEEKKKRKKKKLQDPTDQMSAFQAASGSLLNSNGNQY